MVRGPQSFAFAPAAALVVGNLLDALFTLAYLQLGLARELNPLMRTLYERSPLLFMAAKLAAVSCGVIILSRHARATSARIALWAGAVCYAAIVAFHLAFLARVV